MMAWTVYKRRKKQASKEILRTMVESGSVDLDKVTDADLRRLGLNRKDLKELRRELQLAGI